MKTLTLFLLLAAASMAADRKPPVDEAMRAGDLKNQLGSLPATFTDAREGLAPLPLAGGEEDKFARARAAIDAAEAAGTRWIEPAAEQATVFTDADAALKLERFWSLEPQDHSWTAGVASEDQGGER